MREYNLEDTRIHTSGVFRCCMDVANEYQDKKVQIGFKSRCPSCNEAFTLVDSMSGIPTWIPNWQLED